MLAALAVTALSFFLLENSWVWGCILLLLAVKIISLRNLSACMTILLVIFLFGFRYSLWDKDQKNLMSLDQVRFTDQHFLLYSDELTVRGDLVQAKGYWLEKKQKLLLQYRLKSRAEQKQFKRLKDSQVLVGAGKFQKLPEPTNENEFNWQKFYQAQNIALTCSVTKWQKSSKMVLSNGTLIAGFMHDLRTKFSRQLRNCPKPVNFYGENLLLGVREEGFSTTLTELNKLGLIYLFSLSGMHVFYIVRAVRWCLRNLYFPRELSDIILLLLLPCYAFLGGAATSLTRAILMCWLSVAARLVLRKKVEGSRIWAIVLLLEIFDMPAMFQTLGTQLSYLLTLIILLSFTPTKFWFNVKLNLYSMPLVLYHTFNWNILTMFFSSLATWIFEMFVLPVTLVGCFIPRMKNVASQLLDLVSKGIHFLTMLPGNVVFGKPPLIVIFLWLGSTLALEIVAHKRRMLGVLIASYLIVFIWIHYPLGSEVVYFDIGQGDCTLIREPFDQRIIMIDTGGKVHFKQAAWQKRKAKTTGESIVANYLLSKGITRIDQLYLTHQDADHVGNFASLSQLIMIRQVIVPAGMEKLKTFQHRLAMSKVSLRNVIPVTDRARPLSSDLKILHPFAVGKGTNEDSLVLWLNFHGTLCLFTGDLDRKGELAVLKKYPQLKVDVLKTGHHGSKTASDPKFVHKIAPSVAIISAGRHNRYGHPNKETLVTLRKEQIKFYLTSRVGMIKIKEFSRKKYIQCFVDS